MLWWDRCSWWDEWGMINDEGWMIKDERKMENEKIMWDGEWKNNVRRRMKLFYDAWENERWKMFVWWDLLHDNKIDLLHCGIFYGCIIRWLMIDDW
jgi:hypothetical protein